MLSQRVAYRVSDSNVPFISHAYVIISDRESTSACDVRIFHSNGTSVGMTYRLLAASGGNSLLHGINSIPDARRV